MDECANDRYATARCRPKAEADNRVVAEGEDGYYHGTTGLPMGLHVFSQTEQIWFFRPHCPIKQPKSATCCPARWLDSHSLFLYTSSLNPDCAVASYCDLKILAATLVSRFCSSTYLLICLRHKIAPTARFAMVFCVSLRILLHNLG